MTDKLKPCPFCDARVRSHTIGDIPYVACDNLQCSFTERLTVDEWNDRPAESRLALKAKRYKKAMKAALAQVRQLKDGDA